MISSRKLMKLSMRWQKLASLGRERIPWALSASTTNVNSCSTSSTADKGHFVAYSIDGRRFEIPLAYLGKQAVGDLLQAAEEEFGLPKDGPIMLPCDGLMIEYALPLIQKCTGEDLQKALAMSIASSFCLANPKLVPHQNAQCDSSICSF